jgi:hypothetical protein
MTLTALIASAAAPERLGDSALSSARDQLFVEFDRIAGAPPTTHNVGQMDRIVHAASAIVREVERRSGPAHLDERREAASAKMNGLRRGTIAAGAGGQGRMVGRMAARQGRVRPSPESTTTRSGIAVTAAVGSSRVVAGSQLTDRDQLAELTAETLREVLAPGDTTGRRRALVARARWNYPEERHLGGDSVANQRRIDAVCSPQALVASGGVCLPVNVDYSVPTWAGATRPLRDGLPGFQADRGGLRFVSPPDIGVPSLQATPASGLGSATSVWTEATDASPGGTTKPVYVVQCGSEQLVYVNAIPTRLQFGNMQGRFAPEQIAANTDVAIASAAREAELELLTLMYGSSKQIKAPATPYLGAARDILSAADVLSAKYRYSHRIPESSILTAVFPAWARSLMRSDLARELAHDNTDGRDVMAIADQIIAEWFEVRGINVLWTLDGLKQGTYGTGGATLKNQFFELAGTSATTVAWPNVTSGAVQIGWLLYAEGSYQFLDGGRLTLGVVRDSTLDATNDYETFVETFEGIAFRGVECYQVQSTIKPNGGSAGTIATTSYDE